MEPTTIESTPAKTEEKDKGVSQPEATQAPAVRELSELHLALVGGGGVIHVF